MAEMAFAAHDLGTGYEKGDLISVLPDGWEWGTLDGLPNIWQIAITDLPTIFVQHLVLPLFELAVPGDEEFEAPDEADRKIYRGRSEVRLMWDEMPSQWIRGLDRSGRLNIKKNKFRPHFRKLRYNRGIGMIEKTDTGVI